MRALLKLKVREFPCGLVVKDLAIVNAVAPVRSLAQERVHTVQPKIKAKPNKAERQEPQFKMITPAPRPQTRARNPES